MRRKDRELSKEETIEILRNTRHAVLSMIDTEEKPYATPISPVLIGDDLYFHCTNSDESKRKKALLKNPLVMVTFIGMGENDEKAVPDNFSVNYVSAEVVGQANLVSDPIEKKEKTLALAKIHFPKVKEEEILKAFEAAGNFIDLWKISIDEITGKGRNKNLYFKPKK